MKRSDMQDKKYQIDDTKNRNVRTSEYGSSDFLTKPQNVLKNSSIKHPELPGAELNVMSGVNSLAVNLTPNQSLEMIPVEYPLFNKESPLEDYSFSGFPAWNGSIVQQSVMFEGTIFNKYFDSLASRVKLRYGFYNYSTTGPYGQNKIFERAVISGISQLDSTLYRDLLFNNSTKASSFTITMQGISDARILSLLSYQTFVQNIMLILSAYVRLRKLDKTMYTMLYKRGYTQVRDLMLQVKKSVFEGKIFNIAKMLGDCFFDYEWFKTWRAFSDGVSRQSNAVDDPLVSSICHYWVPTCKLAPSTKPGEPYFDTSTLLCSSFTFSHPLYGGKSNGTVTTVSIVNRDIMALTKMFCELTSVHNVMEWARTSVTSNNKCISPAAYFNNLSNIIDAITEVFTKFKMQSAPIDVFMNVAKRSNWLRWAKSDANTVFKFSNESIEVKYNKFLIDLLTNIHFGPNAVSFDPNSQAFSGYVAWYTDKETASYEQHTGGLPYLSSIRNFELGQIPDESEGLLIPQLFDIYPTGADTIHDTKKATWSSAYIDQASTNAINRMGDNIVISTSELTAEQVRTSNTLSRLQLPDSNVQFATLTFKIPTVTIRSTDSRLVSCVHRLLSNTFYAGRITETSGINSTYDYLDPNLIGFVDWQMKPTSLQVQNYIYTSAPFSGLGYSKPSDLGGVGEN